MGIACIFALGILCGCLGSNEDDDPRDRGDTSHCGGRLLITGIVFIGIFAFFLNFFTGIFMLFGIMGNKVCPLFDQYEFFSEVIDYRPNFHGDYIISRIALNDPTYPLTVKEVIDNCKAGEALWTALDLDHRFNLTTILDINSHFNITSVIGSIPTINGTELVSGQVTTLVNQYKTSALSTIDFNSLIAAANTTLASTDLTTLNTLMNTILTNLNNFQTIEPSAALTTLISNTQTQVNLATSMMNLATTINNLRAPDLTDILNLETSAIGLNTTLDDFLFNVTQLATETTNTVNSELNINYIVDQVIGVVQSFLNSIIEQIHTDFAKCDIFINTYDTVVGSMCTTTLSGLHAIWFSFAIISFLSFFLIFVAFKVGTYCLYCMY